MNCGLRPPGSSRPRRGSEDESQLLPAAGEPGSTPALPASSSGQRRASPLSAAAMRQSESPRLDHVAHGSPALRSGYGPWRPATGAARLRRGRAEGRGPAAACSRGDSHSAPASPARRSERHQPSRSASSLVAAARRRPRRRPRPAGAGDRLAARGRRSDSSSGHQSERSVSQRKQRVGASRKPSPQTGQATAPASVATARFPGRDHEVGRRVHHAARWPDTA